MSDTVRRSGNPHAWLLSDLDNVPKNGVKVVSTFSCGGGSCLGYKRAGCEVVVANDIDPQMRTHYEKNLHPKEFFLCSVSDLVAHQDGHFKITLPQEAYDCDILDGSPPCFPAGTKITTINGDVNIEGLKIGDTVLTHNGKFRKITEVFVSNFEGKLIHLGVKFGREDVVATPNHPFYVKRRLKNVKFVKGEDHKRFADPEWVRAKDVKEGDLVLEPRITDIVGVPNLRVKRSQFIRTSGGGRNKGVIIGGHKEILEEDLNINIRSNNMACLLGLYLAEGHRRGREPDLNHTGPARREVIMSIHAKEVEEVSKLVRACGFNPQAQPIKGELGYRVTITDMHFWTLCGEFGDGASNKMLPAWIWGMTYAWKDALLNGYMFGDGHIAPNGRAKNAGLAHVAYTVSRELAVGLAKLIPEVTGVVASWKLIKKAGKYVIQGRSVNCRDTYSVTYREIGGGSRFRLFRTTDEGTWLPVTSREEEPLVATKVYNIGVEYEHTYVAGGLAVHNCSSFTLSGNRETDWGKEKKFREGQAEQVLNDLFFDFLNLVDRLRPKTVIAENVPGMLMGNAKGYVKEIHRRFEAIGYHCQLFKVNAADCGVPQARTRVFFIACRRDFMEANKLGRLHLNTQFFCKRHISTSEACSDIEILTPEERADTGVKTSQFDTRWWHLTRPGENYAKPRKRAGVKNGLWNWIKHPAHKPACVLISEHQCMRHWGEPRGLTLREFIRLGSFPDDYWAESFDAGKYIIGMSVPPLMAEAVARAVCSQWLGFA